MSVLVGKKAPSFNANAVINGNEIVNNFNLDQFLNNDKISLTQKLYPIYKSICAINSKNEDDQK